MYKAGMRKAGLKKLFICTLSAFAVAGCQLHEVSTRPATGHRKPVAVVPPPGPGPAPAACTADLPKRHRLYTLPPALAPITKDSKGAPLQWAVSLAVDKPLTEIGTWRDLDNGWSSIGLRLASENASGLSVHLSKVNIAEAAQIWVCSPDGHTRRGPLRAGEDGELATAVVPGAEVWLEVLSPTRNVPRTVVNLVEVYGGFR